MANKSESDGHKKQHLQNISVRMWGTAHYISGKWTEWYISENKKRKKSPCPDEKAGTMDLLGIACSLW